MKRLVEWGGGDQLSAVSCQLKGTRQKALFLKGRVSSHRFLEPIFSSPKHKQLGGKINQKVVEKLTSFFTLRHVFMFSFYANCLYIVRRPAENIVQYLERQVILDKPVYCL
jgi:hypothetical protein